MEILIAGLLLWTLIHLIPSAGPALKIRWISALGEKGYKISFALLIALSLVLIVYGWRHSTPTFLYALPASSKAVALGLMVLAFILFGAAKHPTRIRRFIRHPQLASVTVWSVAHLILNGDSRSLLLFGWMGLWALAEIILINRRDGAWQKPDAPTWGQEFRGLFISLIIFAVVVFAHPYLAGVPIR